MMRYMKIVLAMGLVLTVSATAMATTQIPPYPLNDPSYSGWIELKYINFSSGRSYAVPDDVEIPDVPDSGTDWFHAVIGEANVDALVQTNPAILWDAAGEDSVGVFKLTSIRKDPLGTALYADAADDRDVVGFLYGLKDQAVEFGITSEGNIVQKIQSSDGFLKLYVQEPDVAEAVLFGGTRTAFDAFSTVGVADSLLLADTVLTDWDGGQEVSAAVPGGHIAEFQQTDPSGAGIGDTDFYLDGIGGIWNDGDMSNWEFEIWDPNMWTARGLPYSEDGDYEVEVDIVPNPLMTLGPTVGGDDPDADTFEPWLIKSDDPVRAYGVVPEPMTMLGVFMGISGLGGYIRKRRRD